MLGIWDLSNTYGFTLSNNSNSDGNSALQFTKINSQEDHQQQQHLDINTLSNDVIITKCCDLLMINGVIISIKYMDLNKSIEIDI